MTKPNPSYDFAGQVALVTGASSGMGLATALAFSEAGASIVLADINEEAVSAAAADLTAAGHTALAVPCDVSVEDAVADAVHTAVQQFGRLDMAFHNAGIQAPPRDAADEPAETFDGSTPSTCVVCGRVAIFGPLRFELPPRVGHRVERSGYGQDDHVVLTRRHLHPIRVGDSEPPLRDFSDLGTAVADAVFVIDEVALDL